MKKKIFIALVGIMAGIATIGSVSATEYTASDFIGKEITSSDTLVVGETSYIGSEGYFTINSGNVVFTMNDNRLLITINGDVTINEGKSFYLIALDVFTSYGITGFDMTINEGATLTVDGTLIAATRNSAVLTNNGTLAVSKSGIVEIRDGATYTGTGSTLIEGIVAIYGTEIGEDLTFTVKTADCRLYTNKQIDSQVSGIEEEGKQVLYGYGPSYTSVTEEVGKKMFEYSYWFDRTAENKLNDLINSLVESDYTAESWSAYQTILTESKAKYDAKDEDFDWYDLQVREAIANLVKANQTSVTDETSFNSVIEKTIANDESLKSLVDGVTDLKTVVEASRNETIDTNANEELTSILKDATYNVVASYDVSVVLYNGTTELGNITELTDTIKLALTLPTTIEAVADGYTRTYYVLREHNGEYTLLDATLSADGSSIEFETDKFSTYSLVYVDNAVSEAPSSDATTNPSTGDNIVLYAVLGTISLIGLVGGSLLIKKYYTK